MTEKKEGVQPEYIEADVSLLDEAGVAMELLLLHAAPVYYGWGVPSGDNSGVVLIPGFLGSDVYLLEMYGWLMRIGYRPYLSGIAFNAECPNLLIQNTVSQIISKAVEETGGRVHVIGHSLGGVMARSIANRCPKQIASVITLGSPFRGAVAHNVILRAAEMVRKRILEEHGPKVLPNCYTGRCTCEFVEHLQCHVSRAVMQTAIYTRSDGVVDWHYCITKDEDVDFEVPGTHIGLIFNPSAYHIIGNRLAKAHNEGGGRENPPPER